MNPQEEFKVNDADLLKQAVQLFQKHDLEGSRKIFDHLRSAEGIRPEALYGLGCIAFSEGDMRRAQSWFDSVDPRSPRRADAAYYLGRICEHGGDAAGALDQYRAALAVNPAHAAARQKMARFVQRNNGPKAPVGQPPTQYTELSMPMSDDELQKWATRKKAKSRALWRIDAWDQYPAWVNILRASVVVAVLLMIGFGSALVIGGTRALTRAVPTEKAFFDSRVEDAHREFEQKSREMRNGFDRDAKPIKDELESAGKK